MTVDDRTVSEVVATRGHPCRKGEGNNGLDADTGLLGFRVDTPHRIGLDCPNDRRAATSGQIRGEPESEYKLTCVEAQILTQLEFEDLSDLILRSVWHLDRTHKRTPLANRNHRFTTGSFAPQALGDVFPFGGLQTPRIDY